jgi:hypothetical protein
MRARFSSASTRCSATVEPNAGDGSARLSPLLETQFVFNGARRDPLTPFTPFGTEADVQTTGIRVEQFFPADKRSHALFEKVRASGT